MISLFDLAALILTLTALFAWLNHRFIRLPTTIGVMLIALLASLAVGAAGLFGFEAFRGQAEALLQRLDFNEALMHGMLSFMLFAGALHVNLEDLARQKWVIVTLASAGVLLSTFLVGTGTWYILGWAGLELPFIYCLVFGALISPTDPIAVLGILKRAGAPKTLETKITGESLFNDGVAVVVFIVVADLAVGGGEINPSRILLLFFEEAAGGILFGLLLGGITYGLLRRVDDYPTEILLTLALVMGGYALAGAIHVSGPIAVVVAGLLIGNHGRTLAMSDRTREHLDTFWELLDEVLNAVLFVMIGLEVLVLTFHAGYFLAALLLIPLVLLARLVSVGAPVGLLRLRRSFTPWSVTLMTWGGLRGGISVALALSLPHSPEREVIVAITYVIVIFSIVVQGLSVGPLARRLSADSRT